MTGRPCAYCSEPDADVCVRMHASPSGAGTSVYAHEDCAQDRGVPVLYRYTEPATSGALNPSTVGVAR